MEFAVGGGQAVVPVAVVGGAEEAVGLARALVAGGLNAVEVTLRTPDALEAIRAVAREVPEAVVGAGTVLGPEQAEAAVAAGARFLVSPGWTDRLLAAMRGTAYRSCPASRPPPRSSPCSNAASPT